MGYKNNIFKEGLLTGIGKVPTTDILEIGGNIQLDGLIKSDGVGDNYFLGNVGIGTTSPNEKLEVAGKVYIESQGVDWNETTPGLTRGALHFDPAGSGADNTGNAITFGASDRLTGTNAQAGIYTRSDGAYGTKMYFATTDSNPSLMDCPSVIPIFANANASCNLSSDIPNCNPAI